MSSIIENGKVISFHYTLTDAQGTVLDKSQETPLVYLHGKKNIITGLEDALEGKSVGDKFSVTIAAANAYGEYDVAQIQEVPREMFMGVDTIEVGQQFHADDTDGGMQVVTVKDVNDKTVTIDANHPLAGQDLTFEVEVTEVRDATEEETAHGHPHGIGGHQH